ncbi:MAG: ribulose-phosphate 3-epimerase [Chloroflexi bacterium]|nr:MAG: ribulose-phosphate 3-epimerase [Chloroflexota bacterium]
MTRLGEQAHEAEAAGADLLHVDVMDGRFVPNITFGPLVVEALHRVTGLPLDVHLMIVEPERYLHAFANAGASAIAVHLEASAHLHRTLQQIHELGCRAGVAINPHTPAIALSEVLPFLDFIVVMTVNPGFGGQAFIPEVLPKITQLRAMIEKGERQISIEVDGGIKPETALAAVRAGADVLIAGTAVFNAKHTVKQGIDALRAAIAVQEAEH